MNVSMRKQHGGLPVPVNLAYKTILLNDTEIFGSGLGLYGGFQLLKQQDDVLPRKDGLMLGLGVLAMGQTKVGR